MELIINSVMHYARTGLIAFSSLLLISRTSASSTSDTPGAEALLLRAREIQTLWKAETPRLKLRADVEVIDAKRQSAKGQYLVDWISPSSWKEEIRFAGYSRIRVHNPQGYWQKASLNFQPEALFELDQILQVENLLAISPEQKLGKPKSHDKGGQKQTCFEVKAGRSNDRTLCFDEITGNLIRVEYPVPDSRNSPEISTIEFADFRPVGQKRVPFTMRATRDRKDIVTVNVVEALQISDDHSPLFAAPIQSEFWFICDDTREPKLKNRIHPNYNSDLRAKHEEGRVIFYAVIEQDGSVSHLTSIHRATPGLEAAAADAIRQWRFEPIMCAGKPVRVEKSIQIDFWLE